MSLPRPIIKSFCYIKLLSQGNSDDPYSVITIFTIIKKLLLVVLLNVPGESNLYIFDADDTDRLKCLLPPCKVFEERLLGIITISV